MTVKLFLVIDNFLCTFMCVCTPDRTDCGGVPWVLASGDVIHPQALIGSVRFMGPPAAAIFVDVSYQRHLSRLSAVKAQTAKVTSFQFVFVPMRHCTMVSMYSVGGIICVAFIYVRV